jgi:DNA (cytosine-5)-methyltransferase 1
MNSTAIIQQRRPATAEDLDLIVDSFAGGGGASLGIKWATGREPDYAINHDLAAIEMHRANHPGTVHFNESVWKIDPREVIGNGRVQLAWFSPDCTHFSVARGAKPVSPRVRGLAWVVIKWAKLPRAQRPRVIILENVKEFVTWGPLIKKRDGNGKVMLDSKGRELEIPCPRRKGVTFKRWVTTLRSLGYEVEWREIDAADYGAPTHRRRFFLIARCDGKPIVWPQPTHYDPKRKRNLFDAGMKPYRTAAECIDWSLPCPSIFLTPEEARAQARHFGMSSIKRPLAEATMRRIANGLKRYVFDAAEPFIVPIQNYGREHDGYPVSAPLKTITAHPKGGGFAVVQAGLIPSGYGEREGQAPRTHDPAAPLPTCVGTNKHAQVVAFLAKHFGGMVGTELPKPLPTTTQRGTQNQIVTANLLKLRGTCADGQRVDEPAPTISAQGTHVAEVRAFLVKYFGNEKHGIPVDAPASTVTAKERLGLVTIHGEDWQIVDIGMRMLTPRELARCQGFPDDYILTGTKTSQVARIGNSVCPQVVEALVRANVEVA